MRRKFSVQTEEMFRAFRLVSRICAVILTGLASLARSALPKFTRQTERGQRTMHRDSARVKNKELQMQESDTNKWTRGWSQSFLELAGAGTLLELDAGDRGREAREVVVRVLRRRAVDLVEQLVEDVEEAEPRRKRTPAEPPQGGSPTDGQRMRDARACALSCTPHVQR